MILSRRKFLIAAGGGIAAAIPLGIFLKNNMDEQDTIQIASARAIREPIRADGGMHEIIRAATLAANSHNTQPWLFSYSGSQLHIAPDFSRRCPAVDPDDHHLWISLGCASENAIQAASASGLSGHVVTNHNGVTIHLEKMVLSTSHLVDAIPLRQCSRTQYDGKPVASDVTVALQQAGMLSGVELHLITEPSQKKKIAEFVAAGNSAQMDDERFMQELIAWIRFSDAEALHTRDGLWTRSSGNPTVPRWIGARLLPLVMTPQSANDQYTKHIDSSAGVAIFSAPSATPEGWVNVGRAYQRFALEATHHNLKHAFINQPYEVATLREQFVSAFNLGGRQADLIVRYGYGSVMPYSYRRPLSQVIVKVG